MKKGIIIVKGKVLEMLPSFRFEGIEIIDSITCEKFTGDLVCNGTGTLSIRKL